MCGAADHHADTVAYVEENDAALQPLDDVVELRFGSTVLRIGFGHRDAFQCDGGKSVAGNTGQGDRAQANLCATLELHLRWFVVQSAFERRASVRTLEPGFEPRLVDQPKQVRKFFLDGGSRFIERM